VAATIPAGRREEAPGHSHDGCRRADGAPQQTRVPPYPVPVPGARASGHRRPAPAQPAITADAAHAKPYSVTAAAGPDGGTPLLRDFTTTT
jgi:hypothetical protein